ncbi:MAG TPA: hypothetical protein VIO14_13660 [Dehalococcoidia bacterium]|jgi:hypothetical protein
MGEDLYVVPCPGCGINLTGRSVAQMVVRLRWHARLAHDRCYSLRELAGRGQWRERVEARLRLGTD